jgi:hypothetical protein
MVTYANLSTAGGVDHHDLIAPVSEPLMDEPGFSARFEGDASCGLARTE